MAPLLFAGAAGWAAGQALSPNLASEVPAATSPTSSALPTFSTGYNAVLSGVGGDLTGASVSNASAAGSLTSVNEQISEAADLAAAKQSNSNTSANTSQFGASANAMATGFTPGAAEMSSFGAPMSYPGSGAATPSSSSSSSSSTGGSPQMIGRGMGREKSAQKLLESLQGGTAGSAGAKTLSGKADQLHGLNPSERKTATSALEEAATGLQSEGTGEPGQTSDSGSGGVSAKASSAASFPDSTKQTAVLSPPESDESPFATLPEDLSFSFGDLNDMEFLQLRLSAGVRQGKEKQQENIYERFLDRLAAARTAAAAAGATTGLTSSGLASSSLLGEEFGYKPGMKSSSGYGLRTGLGTGLQNPTSNPYLSNPY